MMTVRGKRNSGSSQQKSTLRAKTMNAIIQMEMKKKNEKT